MKLYVYCGPVLLFSKIVTNYWYAETRAASIRKARSNLLYQFKKKFGYSPNAMITLTGELCEVDEND